MLRLRWARNFMELNFKFLGVLFAQAFTYSHLWVVGVSVSLRSAKMYIKFVLYPVTSFGALNTYCILYVLYRNKVYHLNIQ